jgi:hypothetical protein
MFSGIKGLSLAKRKTADATSTFLIDMNPFEKNGSVKKSSIVKHPRIIVFKATEQV